MSEEEGDKEKPRDVLDKLRKAPVLRKCFETIMQCITFRDLHRFTAVSRWAGEEKASILVACASDKGNHQQAKTNAHSALIASVQQSDVHEVDRICASWFDIAEVISDKALWLAKKKQCAEIVAILQKAGATLSPTYSFLEHISAQGFRFRLSSPRPKVAPFGIGNEIIGLVRQGHIEGVVQLCQEWPVSTALDFFDDNYESPLIVASKLGNEDCVRVLIAANATLDASKPCWGCQREWGKRALHIAAANGFADICRLLLDEGANSEVVDKDGNTPLLLAACGGHIDVCTLFADKRRHVDLEAVDKKGKNAWQLATERQKKECAAVLQAAGVLVPQEFLFLDHILAQDTGFRLPTPRKDEEAPDDLGRKLWEAAHDNNVSVYVPICQEWAGNAAVINWANPNEGGKTALCHAAQYSNRSDFVRVLISAHADIEATNSGMQTALHFATMNRNDLICSILVREGANVEATNAIGYRPLHDACECGSPDICRLLLDAGANKDVENNDNQTPLILATETGKLKCVDVLKQAGATLPAKYVDALAFIDFVEAQGNGFRLDTPKRDVEAPEGVAKKLNLAAYNENVIVLAELCREWSGNVQVLEWQNPEWYGNTALINAACKGKPYFRLLVAAHSNLAATNRKSIGKTALHKAAEQGHSSACRILLEEGADPFARDIKGETPLGIAIDSNNKERSAIIRMLKAKDPSWLSAYSFIDELRLKQGQRYRLPAPKKDEEAPKDVGEKIAKLIRADKDCNLSELVPLCREWAGNPGAFKPKYSLSKDALFFPAIVRGLIDVVRLLIACHEDVNARLMHCDSFSWDHQGHHALHHAAMLGNTSICQLLLDEGADVLARDSQGRLPSQVARGKMRFQGNSGCISLLEEAEAAAMEAAATINDVEN